MAQILLNWLVVFILPLLGGGLVRFLLRRRRRAWLFTLAAAAGALAALWVALHPPVLGSELYALRFCQLLCLTVGSFVVGLAQKCMTK